MNIECGTFSPNEMFDIWSQIIHDLSNPSGRSVYDAFWQEDRSLYVGHTCILISIVLAVWVVLQNVIDTPSM